MHGAHDLIKALAMVLCVAAVTSVIFQRLRQPVVLGYIIAGLIIGPHVPIPLIADATIVQTLSELGVILLMFSLGLEWGCWSCSAWRSGAAPRTSRDTCARAPRSSSRRSRPNPT